MGGSAISAGVIAEVVVAARALLRVESGEDVVLARLAQTALLLGEAFLGVAMLVAHLFDHRESDVAPPAAVAALWRPYRRMRLGLEVHS